MNPLRPKFSRPALFTVLSIAVAAGSCADPGQDRSASDRGTSGSSNPGAPLPGEFSPSPGVSGGAAPPATSTTPTAPKDPAAKPPANTGNKNSGVGTNPFVMAAHDPLSTFGADVDSASYDVFRRDVQLGALPRADGVRLEDYVNQFPYSYAAPPADGAAPFTVSVDAASSVLGRATTLMRVGIQARPFSERDKRPMNVVFLVDVSGSMQSADKLPLAKKLIIDTLAVLDPESDVVSVVKYADGVGVVLPPTSVSRRDAVVAAVDHLKAGGGTNGAGGIQLAYEQAKRAHIDGGINHIVLCTDGDFNIGTSSNDELVKLVQSERQSGVTLTALGFGAGNLNDAMMEKVSNAGNGTYSVISPGNEDTYVREKFLSSLVHVAKDMKIQVEFNPERVRAYRLLGYEDRDIADVNFRNDKIDGGEVGAGHRVTALYELVLTGAALPDGPGCPAAVDGALAAKPEIADGDLATVRVRWKAPTATDATAAAEIARGLPAASVGEGWSTADPDLQWAVAMAAYAELLKKSPYAAPSLLPEIERVVTTQRLRDTARTEFAQLFAKAKPLLARQGK